MLQMLALLQSFDLRLTRSQRRGFIHLWVEAAKLAFADRDAFYGDPDFVDVPLPALLSEDYNAERRKLIGDTASAELRRQSCGPTGRLAHTPMDRSHTRRRRTHRDGRSGPSWRHLSPRRDRPLGQYGIGHAERRMAAKLAAIPASVLVSARARRCSG